MSVKTYIHAKKYDIGEDENPILYCYNISKDKLIDNDNVTCWKCKNEIGKEKKQMRKVSIYSIDPKAANNKKHKYYIHGNVPNSDRKIFYDFVEFIVLKYFEIKKKTAYGFSEDKQKYQNSIVSIFNMVMEYFIEQSPEEELTHDNVVNAIVTAGVLNFSGGEENPNRTGYVYKKYK